MIYDSRPFLALTEKTPVKSRRSRTPFARCYDFYAVITIRYAISTGISIATIMLLQPGERGVFVPVQHGGEL